MPPNPRIALVHKADPVLDIVKIGGNLGEILLTKQGSGLEVINQTNTLAVGIKITPNTKWTDLLSPSPCVTPLVADNFPFY